MNIHCLIGNLKAGTSCLGVKCCPLIGHLGTVKGAGLMQCGQGWVRRAFAMQTRDSPHAGENDCTSGVVLLSTLVRYQQGTYCNVLISG